MDAQSVSSVSFPASTPARSLGLYWPLLALITVILVTGGSLFWNYEQPFAFNWDESVYLDEMQMDVSQFHAHGAPGLIRAWLVEDVSRPPAYRIFAFPFAVLFGPGPFTLRMVAILFRIFTLWLLFGGVTSIAGRKTAALAVVFLALCPDFIFFGAVFYNEYALYLAVAGMLCFMFRSWNQPAGSAFNCLGLGVFIGIGTLAKASFLGLAGCFLVIVAFLGLRKRITGPSPQFLLNASVVGALIAAPWWLLNFGSAVHFVKYAMGSVHYTIGPPGIGSWVHYMLSFLQQGFGLPIGCLCIVILIVALASTFQARRQEVSNALSLPAFCVLLAPLPLCLLDLMDLDECLYHISQSLIFFAAGFALLAKRDGWLFSPIRLLLLNLAVLGQVTLTVFPVMLHREYPGQLFAWTVLEPREQWDWNKFRDLLHDQGLQEPSIAYLGFQNVLNPQQIVYPWLSHHEQSPPVTWLWNTDKGTPNLPALVVAASTNDVVFTLSNLAVADWSYDQYNNAYNKDFANRMVNRADFQTPLHLTMGRFHPVDLEIFIRKSTQSH